MHTLISNIKERLTQTLPGIDAQYKMTHAVRKNYMEAPANARIACVNILLYPKNGELHIVFIERAKNDNPNDQHSGQMSFPGGKLDPEDESHLAAALREANEEVGVIMEDIQSLGALTELYIPVSNFRVFPFVGYLDYTPTFIPQESEVHYIVEVPLEYFRDVSIVKKIDMKFGKNITLKGVPYYDIDDKVLWGATAMMMSEFLEVVFKTD